MFTQNVKKIKGAAHKTNTVIVTAHKRSCGEGNVFTDVCLFTEWCCVEVGMSAWGERCLPVCVCARNPHLVPLTPERWLLPRAVYILLECILVKSGSLYIRVMTSLLHCDWSAGRIYKRLSSLFVPYSSYLYDYAIREYGANEASK